MSDDLVRSASEYWPGRGGGREREVGLPLWLSPLRRELWELRWELSSEGQRKNCNKESQWLLSYIPNFEVQKNNRSTGYPSSLEGLPNVATIFTFTILLWTHAPWWAATSGPRLGTTGQYSIVGEIKLTCKSGLDRRSTESVDDYDEWRRWRSGDAFIQPNIFAVTFSPPREH